jgi:hypothetical protein
VEVRPAGNTITVDDETAYDGRVRADIRYRDIRSAAWSRIPR